MSILSRLKANLLLVGLLFGIALLDLMEPLDRMDGWLLIMYGISLASLDRHFNPNSPKAETGPWLPWNQMGAGDKLEYLLPAILFVVMGALLTSAALLGGATGFPFWLTLAGGLGITGFGAWEMRHRWHRRWAALESE
ncbi:MAG: hypothetical protein EDM03_03350 [Porphyrobacter sp. IPPAS B-1204]|nr:MAG: hypothetical protein EDM03_03350 [Porphyrobacter sp. IPPAS B-1204]